MALISSPPPTTSQTSFKLTSSHRPVTTPLFAPRFSSLHRRNRLRCHCSPKNLDYIPKMFREENILDGLMDNYEDVPECLYSRSHLQVDMSMAQDTTDTENINSPGFYERFLRDLEETKKTRNSGVRRSRGAARGRYQPPPDMPSHLLDARVVFIGMPLYESVTELIIQQLMFLEKHDSSKPIYLYIKSTGIKDKKRQLIDSENGAFGIVDTIDNIKPEVHTINMGRAYGAAAMILSSGEEGNRCLFPHSLTRLHLPETFKINGPTTDMWIHVKDLEATADMFLDVLSENVDKPKEEIAKDIRHGKYFKAEEAIEYGLADRIVHSVSDTSFYPVVLEKHAKSARNAKNAAPEERSGGIPSTHGLG